MVLSAPSLDAAPAQAPWLRRISRILRLSAGGVLVLVDRARPERLGELVRHLKSERPDVEVLLEAPQLAAVPEGSTVVLCLRAEDRTWLNLARPIVAARALRLFLWSDEASTVALVQGAIDFFDWISHRIECPEGPPAHVVQALRRAVLGRAPAIVWQGEGFERAFEEACPGRRIVSVSGALPYPEIVATLRPQVREWVAVTDIDGEDRYDRIRWAAAEAGRFGRTVLVRSSEGRDLPLVDARVAPLDDATRRLRAAGCERPTRLAALLDLSEEALRVACELLRTGMAERDLEERISTIGTIVLPDGDAPIPGTRGDVAPRTKTWSRRLPDFPGRVPAALEAADFGVAKHWATRWAAAEPESAAAWLALAKLEVSVGDLDIARHAIPRARSLIPGPPAGALGLDLLAVEGEWQYACGDAKRSLATAEQGARLARKEKQPARAADFLADQVFALYTLRRTEQAGKVLSSWLGRLDRPHGLAPPDLSAARALAAYHEQTGDLNSGVHVLRSALDALPQRHPQRTDLEMLLAGLLLDLGRAQDAADLAQRAARREQRVDGALLGIARILGAALLVGGRFADAEDLFKKTLALCKAGRLAAEIHVHLTMCLAAQGRRDEALAFAHDLRRMSIPAYVPVALFLEGNLLVELGRPEGGIPLLREAILTGKRLFGEDPRTLEPSFFALGRALSRVGELREAERQLRQALRLAEKRGQRSGQVAILRALAEVQTAQGFPQATDTFRRAESLERDEERARDTGSQPLRSNSSVPRP